MVSRLELLQGLVSVSKTKAAFDPVQMALKRWQNKNSNVQLCNSLPPIIPFLGPAGQTP